MQHQHIFTVDVAAVNAALKLWQTETCVRFINQAKSDYLEFFAGSGYELWSKQACNKLFHSTGATRTLAERVGSR
jgi:hypothetical protein